ncbi:hypothetical protein SBRCBS47491_009512 [Sporothrix bragantina]|uniref:Zn(2)-C6 fungal-type domain-containing protein n=1 Tax=Sporothrix bragantina TaxID=671064 RepID=A0ABP0CYS6_9PEZI
MVGVPGRSKGCNTCIQRKVKCDGGQPACGNCRKSNRLCTGYKRPVAFVMSSNVSLAPESIEDPEGGTITTQGRWRKRVRKTPKALAQDPKPKTHYDPSNSTSATELVEFSSSAENRSLAGRSRAIDAVDLTTTVTQADMKKFSKQFLYHDDNDGDGNEDEQVTRYNRLAFRNGTKQVVSTRRAPMTVETLSRVISVLETSGNVAMLDFATPLTLSTSAEAARTQNFNMIPGMASWPLGSPTVQHVSTEAAWRDQLFPMFLRYHLPNELISGCKTTTKTLRSRNWLLNLTDTSLDNAPALETAMTALCMARVGRHSKNSALVQHSLSLYTKGLRQLQEAIHDPDTQLTDQTLAACMAFSMYEVTECPSKHLNGYYSHHTGGLALLKMRGAGAHITPLGHSLFVFMRFQQFVYGLLTRKANFLCEPDWIHKPWQASAKDPQDKFMDQMYCIPVLLEQTDNLEAAGPTMSVDALIRGYWDIIGQYYAIYQCLQGWHKDLQAIVAGPLYWPELSTIPCPIFDGTSQGRPFAVAFHFPAFAIGQSVVMFWLIAMMVNQQLHSLHNRLIKIYQEPGHNMQNNDAGSTPFYASGTAATANFWSEAPSPASTFTPSTGSPSSSTSSTASSSATTADASSPPNTADPAPYPPSIPAMQAAAQEALAITRASAANICQSVEYFLQEEMGDIGPMSMLLPLTTLRHVLCYLEPAKPCPPGSPGTPGENSDEVVWADFLIRYIGGRGQRLAFHLDHT